MARLLLYPGETGPLVDLQAFMRDVHEDVREARAREIEERKKSAALNSEHADSVAAQAAAQAAVNAGARGDEAGMRKALDDAQKALGPSPLEPIPEYHPVEDIDGIRVRFRVLSEKARRTLSSAVMAAAEGKYQTLAEHIQAVSDARAEVVRLAVAEVVGLEGLEGPIVIGSDSGQMSDRDLEALKAAGLHGILYDAAISFQVLPAKKGVRFGLSAGSVSSALYVPGALSSSGPSSDATGVQSLLTLQGPQTSLTPVPVVS